MQRITIIGKSKVGQSLAKAIRLSGKHKLAAIVSARSERFPAFDSDILIIATKDDKITEVARRALKSFAEKPKIVVHLAGSLESTILPPGTARLTLHPIQTFPKPDASLFRGIYWMASSDDSGAIRWARQFITALGGKGVIVLPKEALPIYHAMTVFAANFSVILLAAVEEMSRAIGQPTARMKKALKPLVEKAVANAIANPAGKVLTGPIARRDIVTVRKHQKALKTLDPQIRAIYDAFLAFAERSMLVKEPRNVK